MDLLHFGHCVYLGVDSTSCANSLNISIQTFCVIGYQKDHRIRTFCVIEHQTDHRIQISVCYWTPDGTQDRLLDTVDKFNY